MALFPVISTLLVSVFKLSIVPATLLFFGMPAVYFSWRKPDMIWKSFVFSFIFSLTALLTIDYLAYLDNLWYVPNSFFRFLNNAIPVEDGIWMILWVYFVVVVWEYFLDKDRNKKLFNKNSKYLFLVLGGLLTIFFVFFTFAPQYLDQRYFFLKLGIAFEAIPLILVLSKFPKLVPKVITLAAYFLLTAFLVEYSGLKFGHWYYPGAHYIGITKLVGLRLPLDEILFWWCLGASAVICWYEYFFDDKK